MAVYDRRHTSKARRDEQGKPVSPCREHKQFPSADHGKGDRWQVRWRDENGKQCKRNFVKKAGKDPNTCADAFDAKIKADLDAGMYVDPNAGKITFREYAEEWLAAQTFDEGTRDAIEQRLRLHVYPDMGDKQLGVFVQAAVIDASVAAWTATGDRAELRPGDPCARLNGVQRRDR